MTCPACQNVYAVARNSACPACGHRVTSGVVRSSLVMIGKGGKPSVYRSVEDVPEPLRGELLESTRGINAHTVVIADQRGRQEMARVLKNLPGLDETEHRAERVYRTALRLIGLAIVLSTVALLVLLNR